MEKQQIELFLAALYVKMNLTPLERDIVDTWKEIQSVPFDTHSAMQQIVKNNINHPDVFAAVSGKPTTVQKRPEDIDTDDLKYNLWSQLEFLILKTMRTH